MGWFNSVLEEGVFKVRIEKGKFKDRGFKEFGDRELAIGKNIIILHTANADEVTYIQIIERETGDAIVIETTNWEAMSKGFWEQLPPYVQKSFINMMSAHRKMEAIKMVRSELGLSLKAAKHFIDSAYVLDLVFKNQKGGE
jgi:hypothetical protein